uniref:Uncharacterized protein n=1 Tax=Oryza rufipogon TaxID=4529 RepID=A0A0E0PB38_ORYRU
PAAAPPSPAAGSGVCPASCTGASCSPSWPSTGPARVSATPSAASRRGTTGRTCSACSRRRRSSTRGSPSGACSPTSSPSPATAAARTSSSPVRGLQPPPPPRSHLAVRRLSPYLITSLG